MRKTLIASAVLSILALAAPALAGPPFVCHVFEIGSAKSLPWGESRNNWLAMRDDYDTRTLVADTEKLLTPSTPTIVRMETLRRASIYASRDRALAGQLLTMVMKRMETPGRSVLPDAMALFDAGYVVEAFNELVWAASFEKQSRGVDRVLADLTTPFNARGLIEKSAMLRPGDAAIEFALGLLSRAPENEARFKKAREAAKQDALLAQNLARLQLQ